MTIFEITNQLAEAIKAIKDKMHGRGILPGESAITIAKLQDIEDELRKIGANRYEPSSTAR